jgi:N-acetylglucosamine kinase-like BadF-type ATPase
VKFVIGVDAGGTSTRAAVVGMDGAVLGRGTAGGANPNSHPPKDAAARIADAIETAIGPLDPGQASACVVGMAGAGKLADPRVASIFDAAWTGLRLGCPVRVVTDPEVAFASATNDPDGTVVIAGTGSATARIVDRRLAGMVGGFGWLLGDEGSAFWLGREAVRGTLVELQGASALTALASAVLAEAVGETATQTWPQRRLTFSKLVAACNAGAPIDLARFAPLVSANVGDPLADTIIATAVDHLATSVTRAGTSGPVVLIGSVAGPSSPVGEALRTRLEAAGRPVHYAADGALGAAWLAAVDLTGPTAPRPNPN